MKISKFTFYHSNLIYPSRVMVFPMCPRDMLEYYFPQMSTAGWQQSFAKLGRVRTSRILWPLAWTQAMQPPLYMSCFRPVSSLVAVRILHQS